MWTSVDRAAFVEVTVPNVYEQQVVNALADAIADGDADAGLLHRPDRSRRRASSAPAAPDRRPAQADR